MRVTALIPTHHLPEESMPWISEVRDIFDETIVLIDQRRATPGTLARAEKVEGTVVLSDRERWYDPDRFSLLAGCNSDWIFILEYDEQLSGEWQQAGWRRILETTDFSHFWILRRWVVPGNRYISCSPWWPDFQLRLFRNLLEGTVFPTKLHDRIQVPGPGAAFRSLAIHHHALSLCSRAERESKVRRYEQLRPGEGAGHYYLFEDYHPAEAPLPEATRVNPDDEVFWMDALSKEDASRISIKLRDEVRKVMVSEMFWLAVEVTNPTTEPIYSCPPFPVHLSYHWIQQTTPLMVIFDGERSGMLPGVPANDSASWKMAVVAPKEPGEYILQVSAVQERIRWFDDVNPAVIQELDISVTPKQ